MSKRGKPSPPNIYKARTICKKRETKPLTVYDARQMLPYKGWLSDSDTYGVYCKQIKPYISFKTLRKIISRYDKKRSDKQCGIKAKAA